MDKRTLHGQLIGLYETLSASNLDSDIPPYIREIVTKNVQHCVVENGDTNAIRTLVVGAMRAIYDVVSPREDDPVIRQLRGMADQLPEDD